MKRAEKKSACPWTSEADSTAVDENRTVSLCTFQLHMHVGVPVAVGSKLNNISVETNLSCIQCTFSLVFPFFAKCLD